MAVTLSADALARYRRFSLYNSPFAAHDEGRAIDLYHEPGEPVPSPVSGTVLDVRRVRAPPKPYAVEHDYLVLVDAGEWTARLMHVDPDVEVGDRVAVGDPLGPSIRAGFFAPWVPDHLHLEFRDPDADPYRASGSVPLAVDADVEALDWDGTGTVVEAGETWARLDAPAHPAPGERFVGLASGAGRGVVDGGLPHYDGGGLVGAQSGPVAVAGTKVGEATGRTVTWSDVTVSANGDPVTGLALCCARDRFGAKVVGEAVDLAVGEDVTVTIERR
ncbi:peptidoglycan DD-metalloendopeptidase family protein [Halomicrobium salinisoli]|uniref:peptidoglycan DD-metalloendopeptidase family protein n=1 Tax=Halomicrobium salinisoli TaxID=2878391 RepID=UPI001CF007AA|nr:peptidoglycan DD-metalloendopeptidase family protein [Halomicrobium salinisoli]